MRDSNYFSMVSFITRDINFLLSWYPSAFCSKNKSSLYVVGWMMKVILFDVKVPTPTSLHQEKLILEQKSIADQKVPIGFRVNQTLFILRAN